MDPSRLNPLSLLAAAVDVHWPSMLLAGTGTAIAAARKLPRVPAARRSLLAALSSSVVLITLPVYVWGCLAAFELIRFADVLSRIAMADVEGFMIMVFSVFMSQFVALIVVLLPGTICTLMSDVPGGPKDLTGAFWAIGMVAVDHLLFLIWLTPWSWGAR